MLLCHLGILSFVIIIYFLLLLYNSNSFFYMTALLKNIYMSCITNEKVDFLFRSFYLNEQKSWMKMSYLLKSEIDDQGLWFYEYCLWDPRKKDEQNFVCIQCYQEPVPGRIWKMAREQEWTLRPPWVIIIYDIHIYGICSWSFSMKMTFLHGFCDLFFDPIQIRDKTRKYLGQKWGFQWELVDEKLLSKILWDCTLNRRNRQVQHYSVALNLVWLHPPESHFRCSVCLQVHT